MTRQRLPTVRDVARRAGVSPGTVSRVMSGRQGAADTRRRVLAAVRELGYTPHPAATRLSTGRSHVIAVIVPFSTRPSVSERMNGVVTSLAETPYDLVVHNVETPEQRSRLFALVPQQRDADGVLIISLSPRDAEVPALLESRVPVVLIDVDHPGLAPLSRVVVDDEAGGHTATVHLIALGHTRIGFLGDVLDCPFGFTSSRDRRRGYLRAHAEAGLAPRTQDCALGGHSRAQARALAATLLRRGPASDGARRGERHAGGGRSRGRAGAAAAGARGPVRGRPRRHRDRGRARPHDRAPAPPALGTTGHRAAADPPSRPRRRARAGGAANRAGGAAHHRAAARLGARASSAADTIVQCERETTPAHRSGAGLGPNGC